MFCQMMVHAITRREENLHCDADYAVRCVPETHVTGVWAALRRVPWHDDDEDLNEDEEYGCDIPGLELWRSSSDALVVTSDDVEADAHGQKEQTFRVCFETHDWRTVKKMHNRSLRYGDSPNWNASPAGGATIMMNVMAHFSRYGPMGVPKGFVDTQKVVKGKTPWLISSQQTKESYGNMATDRPISRINREAPMSVARRLPYALSSTRTFNAVTAPLVPKTLVKKTDAAISFDSANSSLGTKSSN